MTAPALPLAIGSRVVLIGGMEVVYSSAWAGSEGVVAGMRVDDDGFEQVFIEWDKGHWRYDGEEDRWTYASHFRVIAPPLPLPAPEATLEPEVTDSRVTASLALDSGEAQPCPDCGDFHEDRDAEQQGYFDALDRAVDQAADSDNFALITISPAEGQPGVLRPHLHLAAIHDDDAWHLYHQMAEIASNAMEALVAEHISRKQTDHGRQALDVPQDDQE